MSEVAGAYKILLQAQPDQALNAFKQVLDATQKAKGGTDSWAVSVTGLNQAWELGKSVLSGAASVVSGVGGAFKDLVASGGELSENRKAFTAYAESVGIDAKRMISSVKDISDNTLTMKESIELAGSAIKTGLSEDQIGKVFTFAKRQSEITGEEFNSLAARLVESMAKGGKAFKEFGFVVEKGNEIPSLFRQIDESLVNFGDAGFNANDSLTAISSSFTDLYQQTGEAIGQSETFQALLGGLSDAAVDFVNSFDFSKITKWTEAALQFGEILLDSFGISGKSISEILKNTFEIGGVNSAKAFFSYAVTGASNVLTIFGSIWNKVPEFLNWFSGAVGKAFNFVQSGVAYIGVAVDNAMADVKVSVLSSFYAIFQDLESFAERNPITGKLLGIDSASFEGARDAALGFYEDAQKEAIKTRQENKYFMEELTKGFAEGENKAAHLYDGFLIDVDGAKAKAIELLEQINKIKVSEDAGADDPANKERESLQAKLDRIKAEIAAVKEGKKQEAAAHKEHESFVKQVYDREAKAAEEAFSFGLSQEEKAFKRQQEDALDVFKKQLESQTRFTTENGSISFGGINEANIDEIKALREKELTKFKRQQEDALDLYQREQKSLKEKFAWDQKTVNVKDKGTEAMENFVKNQEAKEQKADAKQTIGQKQGFTIKMLPSGNEALDYLFGLLAEHAEIEADAELAQVVAP